MRHYETLISSLALLSLSVSEVASWTTSTRSSSIPSAVTENVHVSSRQDFMKTVIASTIGVSSSVLIGGFGKQIAFAVEETETKPLKPGTVVNMPNGVTYTVIKSGTGPLGDRGELVAIRFSAYCGDIKLDDIFDTPEPYYTRVGSGGLLKGVEETIPLMHLGDRWKMVIPSDLAFGKKGRPSSAGKPRVPADSTIVFEVEVVGIPGKEPELIELIGDY